MLDSIRIQNFRSCEEVRLRLEEPVVALAGKNGVGKTNVLHAIQIAAGLSLGVDFDDIWAGRASNRPLNLDLEFTLADSRYMYRVSRSPTSMEQRTFAESLEHDGSLLFQRTGEKFNAAILSLDGRSNDTSIQIGFGASTLPTLLQLFPAEHPIVRSLTPVAEFLRSIQYHPLLRGLQDPNTIHPSRNEFSPFISSANYDTWKSRSAMKTHGPSVEMRLLHLHLTDVPRFNEIKLLMGDNGLGLLSDIVVEEVRLANQSSPSYVVTYLPGNNLAGSGQSFSFNSLSSGTLRILQLISYLIFDENTCMLVEQPEDSIHPGLLAKVIDILHTYSGRTQLICTTHSPRVMNLIGPKGIRLVTASDGITSVSELSDEELNLATAYLEDEGTLAEFLETL